MMMLNKDEKFENVKRKWRFGWRKIEAHWVHKSWVFQIQTNVENFEKIWKIFSVHLSAENNPENGPRRTIRYQELSELFGKLNRIVLSWTLDSWVKMTAYFFGSVQNESFWTVPNHLYILSPPVFRRYMVHLIWPWVLKNLGFIFEATRLVLNQCCTQILLRYRF